MMWGSGSCVCRKYGPLGGECFRHSFCVLADKNPGNFFEDLWYNDYGTLRRPDAALPA